MGKRAIIRSVLALCLTAAGLAALFGLLAGTQSQVYAASSRPVSGAASTESAPPSGPAASLPLAPLSNGSETAVITVCNSCPYTTVQAAVSDIPSGGVVKVAQGTYTDTDADSRVVYITKSLTLQGGYTTTNWSVSDPAAHPTTLDGEDSGRVIMIVSGISPTIEGFHIINGSGSLGGGVYIAGGGTVLRRNRIYDNAATDRGGGICIAGGAPILRNNFIYTNTAANGGGGVCVTNGAAPLLHHNTLYDNLASGTGGGVYIASGAPVISATIIVSNTASDGGGVYGAGGLLGYNDVWGNSGGEYGGGATAGSTSISNDPLFADPSGLDLRIQAGSPCKDQVPSTQMAEVDYWGLARPFGNEADIGAHEFYTGDCFARIGAGQVYSTVQAAVDAAGAGDLVKVAGICRGVQSRTVGSIVLTQTVFISKALTLRGGYTATNWTASDPDAYPTTLDAQEQGRVVYIGGVAAMVEGFHICNGGPPSGNGGGIYIVGGSPVVRNNNIYSNTTAGAEGGGGIYIYAGTPTVENNAVYNNSATTNGGGLHNRDGSPIVRNNTIYSNTANRGGGIYVAAGNDSHIQSNWIYSNTAGTIGGGIYAAAGYIQSNWIYSNAAGTRGGGIYVAAGLRIESNWIHSNRANGSLSDDGGGGIYVASGASAIRGNAIYNNVINGSSGGGINIWSDGVVVEQNTIHHNSGGYRGGGIYVRDYNQTIRNNLIYNNSANSFGGGIAYWWGNGTIENNTIYSNTLDGIYNAEVHSGSPTIRNNIIVSNTTYGIRRGSGSLTVYYNDVSGNSTSNYLNINSTTDITATPQLVNPGVDFRLQPGSPCIDAADPSNYPPNDYVSYARPFGSRADMGAYEFYAGTCFAQVEGATQVYTTVQAALDVVTQATTVKVAGLCQGAQPRPVGSETFTQTAYISQSLTLRGGYTVTNWTTPTAQTILDAVGQGRAVYITSTGAVTVDGFIVRGGNAITGGGLYFATPLSPTVQNVIFYSNTAQYGGGLAAAGGNPRLYNNTFVVNTAAITGGGVYLAGGSPAISNTIVVSNAGGGIWAGSGASLAYNDVWENVGGDYVGSATASATDFSADPLFANFAERDFHLSLDSPCVHTADPGTALAWDLEGDDRPLGRRADVGADENAIYADVRFAPFSWLDGIPGQPTVHPHILTNTGSISDTFDLIHTLVTSDSTGWEVYYTPVFTLAAGEVAESPVTVVVPNTAISGTIATVILTATSRANSVIYDVVSNTTMVNWNPGVELAPDYVEHVNPGTVMTYAHTLTNTGNAPDTFDLSFSSSYGWTKEVTPTQVVDLGARVTTTVWVRVEAPGTAPGGLIETTVITAVSPSSGVRALVTNTTEVNYTTGDRYVAGSGEDTLNNCLVPNSPCQTIDHAVDQAVSGDTVKVREGTYNENNVTLNKDITLRGGYYDTDWKSDPANHPAIVDAQGAGRVFYVFGNPTIEGFTIRGGGTAGSGGGIYIYSLGSPIIRGNVITGNTAGVHGGGIHNELGNPTIEQNTLAYNEASRGGGFSSAAGSPGFWSNMVYDNTASTNGGGVYVTGGSARIWHDTIYHNTAQNGGGVYLLGGSPVVSNTIVVKNTATITGGGIYKQAVGAALDYNNVWNNTNGDYVGATAGPHSISDDPDFLNEAARDLHLGFSSPCENEGDATSVAEDYDGQPRTMGSAPDIGADEIRRLGVELAPDNAKSGDPGTQITYDHVVTNTGNYTDTFTISASSSHGWSVETPSNPVAVGPGQSAGIQVKVTIPSDAVWGVEDRTVVTATSGINPALSDTALDTTTVNLKCGIAWLGQLAPWHRSGADTEIGFGQELENQDNYTETFDISWSWSGDEWPVIVSPDPVTLGPDTSRTIWFTVTVPPGSDLMVNHLTITATATTNCSDSTDPPAVHTFVINQDPGLTLVQNESGTDDPGQIVTYEHLLTNTGNYYDNTIWLTWQTNPSWSVMVNEGAAQPLEISLAQDETVTITVDVIIPDEATCGMSNTTIITATSWAGYYAPDYQVVRVSVTDTTAVRTVYGVELAPDLTGNINSDPSQPVTITYNHRLTNTGNCVQQFGFLYHSSLGFTVTVPSSVWLNPIEAEGVTVYVTMPPTTTSDLLVDTTVITTYHWEAMGLLPSDIVVDTTIVNQVAGVTLAPDNTGVVTQPSSTDVRVLYTHTLTNSGNYTDTFDLTWLNEDGWRVDVNGQIGQPAEVTVGSNLATVITAEVTVPSWIYTITNRMVITAASQFSPTVTASAVNTTTVRRPHVTLQPDYTQNVAPGDVIAHVHTLTNTGGVSDSYAITYHSSLGWAAVVPTTVYTLPPGGTAPVTATISVPTGTDIISGTLDRLVITATSQITAVVYDTAVDLTTVPYAPGAALTPTPYNGQGRAGVPIPYTHTLTNLGNYTESFRLQVWSEFANGSVSPEWVYDLGPGESYTPVIVTVLLPTHAAAGETEETQVLVSFAGERIVAHDYTLVTASSGTRYVAPEGTNDNNSCLVPYDYGPCATVQQAVDQALAGDEAHIAQGVYTDVQATGGYTQAVYLDKNVTLLGGYVNGDWSATPDPTTNQTVLNAGGQGRVVYVAAGVTSTIEGFHLQQGYVAGDGAGLYVAIGAAPTVRRNFIYSNTAAGSGSEGGGAYYHYTGGDGDLVLERNTVYNNSAEIGGGIYLYGSYGPGVEQRVWNNAFYGNVANDGGGLYIAGDSVTVWNNTFYSNTATNGGGVYFAAGSSAISNTIFSNNSGYGVYKNTGLGGTPKLDYNLVWANSPANFSGVAPGSNTITTTPGFVDAASGDLHLRSDSLAIEQGDPNGTLPDVDLDGNPRPLPASGRHDVGAYENGLESGKTVTEYAPAGGAITYTIAVTNSGAAPRDIAITDRLHDYLDYVSLSSTPAGSSDYSDHTVSWQGTVYSETTAVVTITATITDWLMAGTTITNIAQINYVSGSVVTTVVTGTPGARYVVQTGDDSGNNCLRPDLPCRTIQYAAAQALASDEVRVASGVYTGTDQVAYVSKAITLTGGYTPTLPAWTYDPSAYTTTLDAQGGQGVVITGSVAGMVNGFHIVNGSEGVAVYAATAVISRCRIYNNSDGVSATDSDLTLVRSWVYDNSDDGVDVNGGAYTLINNIIAHNTGAGVRAAGSSAGSLLHNTFARNTAAGAIVNNTARFTNTVFYSHTVGLNVATGSAYLSNTLWYSNTANAGAIVSSANLFDADPRFENPDGMDYHVQPGSSVIDQGVDTWLGEDVDGDHRPLLQHPDLGADEFALVIVKHAPASADPNQVITYSIVLQGGESGLVLTDTLDAYLTCTGTVICPDAGSCGYLAAQRAITWTGDLPAVQPAYITYTAQVTTWLAAGAQILNDAQVLIAGDVHNTNQVATTINSVSGVRYVDAATGLDTDGGTGNNCLAQWKPCATVQYAVNQAQANDTVKVAAGTYNDAGQVVSIDKALALIGGYTTADWNTSAPEANPTYLDGQGSGRVITVTGPATVMIDGFHLLNGSVNGDGGGLYVNGATVTLSNSRVYNNSVSGTGNGGGIYAGSGDFTLVNSQVYSNTAGGSGGGLYLSDADAVLTDNRIYTNTSGSYGGGLHTLNGSAVLMERNVVLDNQAAHGGGASVTSTIRITMTNNIIGSNHASSSGDGLLFDGYGSGNLRHNTIADNGGAGIQVGNFTLNLTNTILSGHTVGITTTVGANVTTDRTLLDGNGTDYDNSGGGSINASNDVAGPSNYRDQAALDYHITGSSAAAGAGIEAGVDTDIDGENRSSPPDIGADQYNLRTDRWASSTEVALCQTIVHTLALTNVADSLIPGVVLTDALPAEVTYNSGSITYTAGSGGYLAGSQAITWRGDVAAQSSVYITYTVNVNPYLADGTTISFSASISDPISAFAGNPLNATVRTITATTHKEGVGAVSPAGQATIGEIVTYTVVYTVPGGHETYDPVVVDALPRLVESGVVSTATALAYVPGSLSITGATTQTEEFSPDGSVITWTLHSVTATCGVPTVATLTFNARVLDLADNTAGDTLTDTLTISYTDGSSDRVIGDEQVLTLVEPGLTLAHTAAPTQNLGMGDLVVITITATNPGNVTLYDAAITDTLGSGWVVEGTTSAVFTHTLGNVDAGNSVPVTFTARVDDGIGPAADLTATASAAGSSLPGVEPDERGYVATEPLTVTTGSLDLEISKEGTSVRSPNQRILYTIGYTNTGVVRAEGVQIADTLPFSLTDVISATSAGATVEHVGQTVTWTLTAPVSRSLSGSIWITATIAAAAEDGSVLTNTVSITTTRVESDTANNSDSVATTVRLPSLSITKTAEIPYTRQLLTYTLTISNSGLGDGTNLLITDTVPLSTTYHSCSGGDCGFESGSGVVTWTLPSLPAGEQTGVTLTVRVDSGVYSGTTLVNQTYGVTCAQGVTDAGAPLASTVAMWREVQLSPTSRQVDIQPEEQVVYTHTLTNLGNATATFSLTVSSPPTGWTYDLQPPDWITDLAPDHSAVITLTVTAPASANSEAQAAITATWQGYTESATAVDTTTIGNYKIYLPLVLRSYH